MSFVACKTKPKVAENVVRQIKDLLSDLGPADKNSKVVTHLEASLYKAYGPQIYALGKNIC